LDELVEELGAVLVVDEELAAGRGTTLPPVVLAGDVGVQPGVLGFDREWLVVLVGGPAGVGANAGDQGRMPSVAQVGDASVPWASLPLGVLFPTLMRRKRR
jgi:hypothetical protein